MVRVYKRGIFKILISLISGIIGSIIVFFIAAYFLDNILYVLGISGLVLILMLFTTLSSDSIHFELEGNVLRYFEKNKLKKEYILDENTDLGYKQVTGGSFGDVFDLRINGDVIDAEPLGGLKFHRLYSDIEAIVGTKVTKVMVKENE